MEGQREVHLSPREKQVLGLLAAGQSKRDMSRDLHLALNTVHSIRGSIKVKLGLERRASVEQLLARAREFGLIPKA